jgi:2-iminobutanoate/2-iminopropanoate deaminase
VLYLGTETKRMKKVISTYKAPAAIGPYSQAILSGNTLYCSGQIAINPVTGNLVIENITEETNQVMQNILAVLNEAEMDFSHVVKCSIFMKDMNDYAAINSVYANSFGGNPPAREAVQVSVLPKNVNVEISVIAVK